jgi:hypothetical protein
MKLKPFLFLGCALTAAALLSAPFAGAQQTPQPAMQANVAYDLRRETVLQGTIISFTANSGVAPTGARATIQTASGPINVHLGNAALLKQSDIILAAGDSVRIVGQNETFGDMNFFAARVLQKGSQSLTLRNSNGIPLSPKRTTSASAAHIRQGGAQ